MWVESLCLGSLRELKNHRILCSDAQFRANKNGIIILIIFEQFHDQKHH